MTPLPQNTSTTSHSQIPSGPSIKTVYYDIPDTYTSQKLGFYDSVFSSTRTTIPSQDTLAKQRPFMLYVCNTTGQDFKPMSRITANHAPLVPMQNLCAIDLTDFLLKQLPIPEKPWTSISLDFIEKLRPSSSGYTAILVIIDHLSKEGLFIPTHDTITSQQLAQLFVLHVFSKHGFPSHVTSDRGPEFISHFFWSLGIMLNMKLHFTSGYYPEGDGQTE